MVLKTRSWGEPSANAVVCVHGVAQHGGVFAELGARLAAAGQAVLAVDLRGHGESGREPPWSISTHVADLLETLDANGIERATWIGHSFGGRVVAEAAAAAPERTDRLVLLDPGLEVPVERALRGAEIDRLDWSFATVDGALNALLSNDTVVAAPREVVAAYVRDDVRKGPDGRFRFSHSPAAAVVAWSEMTLPFAGPPEVPTLAVLAEKPLYDTTAQVSGYQEKLGDLLTVVRVPNGHNLLWESPAETIAAIERFIPEPR
jgi:lipase